MCNSCVNVIATVTENGNLRIDVTEKGKTWLKDVFDVADQKDFDVIEAIVDDYQGEGIKLYRILPEWIGALTDAPIVCDKNPIDYVDDDGVYNFPDSAKFWWYEPYQVSCFAEVMFENGFVVFSKSN